MTPTVARRYANAFLELAGDSRGADRLVSELESFLAQVRKVPALQELLADPTAPAATVSRVVQEVASRMVLSETVRSFLGLLATRRRLGRPEVLLAVVREERDRRQGRATGLVESAGPLSVIQVARIRDALGKALGRQLTLEQRRDPGLLDGVRVTVGDRVFDLTARTWLKTLRERLATVR